MKLKQWIKTQADVCFSLIFSPQTSVKRILPVSRKRLLFFIFSFQIYIFLLYIIRQAAGGSVNLTLIELLWRIFTYTLETTLIFWIIYFIVISLNYLIISYTSKQKLSYKDFLSSLIFVAGHAFYFERSVLTILVVISLTKINIDYTFIKQVLTIIIAAWQGLYLAEIVKSRAKIPEWLQTLLTTLYVATSLVIIVP